MYRDIPERLKEVIEPVVEDHGFELVDAEFTHGRGPGVLRVIIDTPEGDGSVSIESCAAVSREIGTHLDAGDVIPHRYRLGVSSPGLDRILAREKDFEAACGLDVRIQTRRPLEDRRRFRGRLVGFDQAVARVLVDGENIEIPFAEVARANTVYEFTAQDFVGARRAASDRSRKR